MTNREQEIKERRDKALNNNIYKEKNLFFVHIPKNAGRMVRLNLWNPLVNSGLGPIHYTANFLNSLKGYENVENFTFSRNPYTRLASCYYFFYPRSLKRKIKQRKIGTKLADHDDFRNFVYNLPNLSINYELGMKEGVDLGFFFAPQVNWINEKTIFIGKKENLLEDMNKLLDLLEIQELKIKKLKFRKSFTTPRHESEGIPYMDLYDEHMIKIVNEIYKEDFIKFDYEML